MTAPRPLTRATLKRFPLPPVEDGDKHAHGRLLIIAGSRDLAGASLLTATAAMRVGAGKLKIATVASAASQVGTAMPESMTVGLAEGRDGGFARSTVKPLRVLAEDADAVVAGPGMMANSACSSLARELLRSPASIALDAGLLRSLRQHAAAARAARAPSVLLPHADEMASLLDCEAEAVEAEPLEHGRRCANLYGAVVLVKGVQSYVVAPNGDAYLYKGGGPGLGVSGSGDTLAGIAGGLLARGAEPLTALLWSVFLHGEAGRRLGRKIGTIGYLAREIPDELPALLDELA